MAPPREVSPDASALVSKGARGRRRSLLSVAAGIQVAGTMAAAAEERRAAFRRKCLQALVVPPDERMPEILEPLLRLVKTIKAFEGLDPNQRNRVASTMTIEHFPPHTDVFTQGSVGNKFYIVLTGSVDIYIRTPDDPNDDMRASREDLNSLDDRALTSQNAASSRGSAGVASRSSSFSKFSGVGHVVAGLAAAARRARERTATGEAADHAKQQQEEEEGGGQAAAGRRPARAESLGRSVSAKQKQPPRESLRVLKAYAGVLTRLRTERRERRSSQAAILDFAISRQKTMQGDREGDDREGAPSHATSGRDASAPADVDRPRTSSDATAFDKNWEDGEKGKQPEARGDHSLRNAVDFPAEDGWVLAAVLNSGEGFGELALINDKPRSGTARTSGEPTTLIVVNKEDYLAAVAGQVMDKMRNKIVCISECPVFKDLPPNAMQALAYYFKSTSLPRGAPIYRQGDKVSACYIMQSGTCDLEVAHTVAGMLTERGARDLEPDAIARRGRGYVSPEPSFHEFQPNDLERATANAVTKNRIGHIRVMTIANNTLFGTSEIFLVSPRRTTAIATVQSSIYFLELVDLLQKVPANVLLEMEKYGQDEARRLNERIEEVVGIVRRNIEPRAALMHGGGSYINGLMKSTLQTGLNNVMRLNLTDPVRKTSLLASSSPRLPSASPTLSPRLRRGQLMHSGCALLVRELKMPKAFPDSSAEVMYPIEKRFVDFRRKSRLREVTKLRHAPVRSHHDFRKLSTEMNV